MLRRDNAISEFARRSPDHRRLMGSSVDGYTLAHNSNGRVAGKCCCMRVLGESHRHRRCEEQSIESLGSKHSQLCYPRASGRCQGCEL